MKLTKYAYSDNIRITLYKSDRIFNYFSPFTSCSIKSNKKIKEKNIMAWSVFIDALIYIHIYYFHPNTRVTLVFDNIKIIDHFTKKKSDGFFEVVDFLINYTPITTRLIIPMFNF